MNIYKELRKEEKLKQIELAKILNVEQATISKWEVGKSIPDTPTLKKLAEFFNVSVDYLLGRNEPELTPEEIAAGITTTATMKLNDDERELIIAYRDLGKKKGAAFQLLVRDHLNKLLSL